MVPAATQPSPHAGPTAPVDAEWAQQQAGTAHTRTRPLPVGHLRAFEAVARHLNFRLAAEELSVTQSAVSRQIQGMEDDVGVPLFLRHTRSVSLTPAGTQLLRSVLPALERIDQTVRQIRASSGRRTVAVTTWASFASLWLIPRLEAFQATHPDIDIRIDATDARVDLAHSDLDLALRYTRPGAATAGAIRLFGEQITAVASPWLLRSRAPIRRVVDLSTMALIESSDVQRNPNLDVLGWRRWLTAHGAPELVPRRWLYFNYANQIAQAALSGQGVALVRTPLVASALAGGELVEVLPQRRLDSPLAYWLFINPVSEARPEIQAFARWVQAQAMETRAAIGEMAAVGAVAGVADPATNQAAGGA